MSVQKQVTDLIANQLGLPAESITPDKSFAEDLGADSLDVVEVMMEVEEQFGRVIPDDDAAKLVTVGDLIKYLENDPAT